MIPETHQRARSRSLLLPVLAALCWLGAAPLRGATLEVGIELDQPRPFAIERATIAEVLDAIDPRLPRALPPRLREPRGGVTIVATLTPRALLAAAETQTGLTLRVHPWGIAVATPPASAAAMRASWTTAPSPASAAALLAEHSDPSAVIDLMSGSQAQVMREELDRGSTLLPQSPQRCSVLGRTLDAAQRAALLTIAQRELKQLDAGQLHAVELAAATGLAELGAELDDAIAAIAVRAVQPIGQAPNQARIAARRAKDVLDRLASARAELSLALAAGDNFVGLAHAALADGAAHAEALVLASARLSSATAAALLEQALAKTAANRTSQNIPGISRLLNALGSIADDGADAVLADVIARPPQGAGLRTMALIASQGRPRSLAAIRTALLGDPTPPFGECQTMLFVLAESRNPAAFAAHPATTALRDALEVLWINLSTVHPVQCGESAALDAALVQLDAALANTGTIDPRVLAALAAQRRVATGERLISAFQAGRMSATMASAALAALPATRDPRRGRLILDLAQSSTSAVLRATAISVLAQLDDPALTAPAAAAASAAISDPDPATRRAALRHFLFASAPAPLGFVAAFSSAIADPDAQMRQLAVSALGFAGTLSDADRTAMLVALDKAIAAERDDALRATMQRRRTRLTSTRPVPSPSPPAPAPATGAGAQPAF